MLYQAIENIQRALNDSITPTVAIGNVVDIVGGGDEQNDTNIIISLVNIEEVRLARDQQYVVKINDQLLPKHPPVHLDITLLFTAYGAGYENNIRNLQDVIAFFQRQPVFRSMEIAELAADGIDRLTVELVTLSLEQLQQLWSMLGGKYQPSILYKIRMLTIDSVQNRPVAPIKQIDTHFKRKG
ncbi:hypothetical protein GCM10007415_07430 [Parapedobacter pyrenivorans]|uniref:Pvc16 N-terminal domain-containing protein n=1 Tax=Parapedobacter pyrenivorans TaxID=1305674 RepID=A0A917HGL8_9SPHI|nr:DUF4255 domain-containing protein [Parapedobacter pyrenivorans]GGG77950.1 hypothetical protein GCM10007415_07430 [Parapedobacter pyrenivorans]